MSKSDSDNYNVRASADFNDSVDDEAKTKLVASQSSFQWSWSATTLRESLLRARLWFNMAELASISFRNESTEVQEMDMRKRISEISKAKPAIVSTRKVNFILKSICIIRYLSHYCPLLSSW